MSAEFIAAALFGYLLGSLPFGLLITKFAGLGDIRQIGSGNIGATNVLRTGNKGLAFLTLLADIAKGFIPAVLFKTFYGLEPYGLIAGFAALIGHMFPVWLKFKGGKGVATYIGAVAGISFSLAGVFALIWLSMAFFFRYSSLSAIIAATLVPLISLYIEGGLISLSLSVMSLLVILRHWANIQRLISGREDKIGQKDTN